MALQLGLAIQRGLRRALNRSGYLLMGLMMGYTVGFLGSMNALFLAVLPPAVRQQGQFGFAFPLPIPAAAGLMGVALLFGLVITLAAARAFTRVETELAVIDRRLFTRRMGPALLGAVIANSIIGIAVLVGFVLLIVPGLYLAVSFTFVQFAIAVEDRGPLAALRRSWALARGHRWRLLGLVVLVGAVTGAVSALGSITAVVLPAVGQLIGLLLASIFSVLGYGVLADAYVQLTAAAEPNG